MQIRHILVPTDFSDPATEAWNYARTLAVAFKSRLHLLHVVAEPYLYDAWGTEAAALHMATLLARSEGVAQAQIAKLVPKTGPLAGRVSTTITNGVAVDRILEYISSKRIDLVVMGTHGRGVVGHLLIGSVAERVAQRSPAPVLMVRGAAGGTRRPPKRRGRRT